MVNTVSKTGNVPFGSAHKYYMAQRNRKKSKKNSLRKGIKKTLRLNLKGNKRDSLKINLIAEELKKNMETLSTIIKKIL